MIKIVHWPALEVLREGRSRHGNADAATKQMLPLVGKPVNQYGAAGPRGCEAIVTGRSKRAIEATFDLHPEASAFCPP